MYGLAPVKISKTSFVSSACESVFHFSTFFISLGRSAVCSTLCSKPLGVGEDFTGGVGIDPYPLATGPKPAESPVITLPNKGLPSSVIFCPSR